MSRLRNRLAGAALAFLVVGGATPAATARAPATGSAKASRPDIVIFIADDLSREDLGPYGSQDARTPNIDALAAQGLRFTNAFAASPTCTPSRSALLTGDYPIRNGAHANHTPVKPGTATLPVYFRKLGYRVVIAGKTDFGERSSFPFEYLAGSTVHPPGKPAVLQSVLGVDAIDHLLATRDKARPLALIVADYASHLPWLDNQGYDAGKLTLEPDLYDTPETRASRTRYLTKVTLADTDLGAVRASIARHGSPGNTLLFFIADQGALFPSAKYNLYDQGIAVPMIASWPGHVLAGRNTGALVSLVDMLPTFQAAAGGPAMTGVDGHSFLPVLLGQSASTEPAVYAAHTGEPGEGANKNRAPMRAIRTDRFKLIENLRPDIPFVDAISANPPTNPDTHYWASWVAAARTDADARFLTDRFRNRPPLELYDLRSDPYELHNLATDPRYAVTLKDLRARLDAWRVGQGERLDQAIMPDDTEHGHFPYTTCPCNTGVGAGTPAEEPGRVGRAGRGRSNS